MFIKVQINVDDRAQKYKGANGSKLAKKKSFLSDYRWTADPNRIFFSQYLILHSTYYLQQQKITENVSRDIHKGKREKISFSTVSSSNILHE